MRHPATDFSNNACFILNEAKNFVCFVVFSTDLCVLLKIKISFNNSTLGNWLDNCGVLFSFLRSSHTARAEELRFVFICYYTRDVNFVLSTEIRYINRMQFSTRRIFEQRGTILSFALFHPMAVHTECASIDDLQCKRVK